MTSIEALNKLRKWYEYVAGLKGISPLGKECFEAIEKDLIAGLLFKEFVRSGRFSITQHEPFDKFSTYYQVMEWLDK